MEDNKTSKTTFATTYLDGFIGSIKKVEKNDKIRVYISLATHRKVDGVEKTDWHNIVAYGNLASIADQFLKVGQKIFVEGEAEIWDMKDENDNPEDVFYIKANAINFNSASNISLIGFLTGFSRKDEDSPLITKICTIRKVLKDDEKIEKIDAHKVCFYGDLADTIEKYATKGVKIAIIGNILKEDIDGKTKTYIRARRAKIM